MSLETRFTGYPDRITNCFKHLDAFPFFTSIREKTFGDKFEELMKKTTAKKVDEAIKIKWEKNTKPWRDAMRSAAS